MTPKLSALAIASLLFTFSQGLAQPSSNNAATPVPVATRSEIECSGFISGTKLPSDISVFDGSDNYFRMATHLYQNGQYVYLHGRQNENFSTGMVYRLVRLATRPIVAEFFYSGQGPLRLFDYDTWYPGQLWSIRSLGTAYQDIGRVKVVAVTPQGAVAKILFSCTPVAAGDIAVPYQPRVIPTYTPSAVSFSRFTPPRGKLTGAITAATDNLGSLGDGSIVYVNLGRLDGAKAGQRYRIFPISKDLIHSGFKSIPKPPVEYTGELVILFTEQKSSVAMIVKSIRQVFLGDGIQLEKLD